MGRSINYKRYGMNAETPEARLAFVAYFTGTSGPETALLVKQTGTSRYRLQSVARPEDIQEFDLAFQEDISIGNATLYAMPVGGTEAESVRKLTLYRATTFEGNVYKITFNPAFAGVVQAEIPFGPGEEPPIVVGPASYESSDWSLSFIADPDDDQNAIITFSVTGSPDIGSGTFEALNYFENGAEFPLTTQNPPTGDFTITRPAGENYTFRIRLVSSVGPGSWSVDKSINIPA